MITALQNSLPTIITTAVGVIVLLINQLRDSRKQARDRAERINELANETRLQETRLKVAIEIRDAAREATMRNHVREINQNVDRTREVLDSKIEDNTQVSVRAFTEANNVNLKIAGLQAQLLDKLNGKEEVPHV